MCGRLKMWHRKMNLNLFKCFINCMNLICNDIVMIIIIGDELNCLFLNI
jgi:hypothetical protein